MKSIADYLEIKETEAALWIKVGEKQWQVLKIKNKQLLADGIREKKIKITQIMYRGALPEKYYEEMARRHPDVFEREFKRVGRQVIKVLEKEMVQEQGQSI